MRNDQPRTKGNGELPAISKKKLPINTFKDCGVFIHNSSSELQHSEVIAARVPGVFVRRTIHTYSVSHHHPPVDPGKHRLQRPVEVQRFRISRHTYITDVFFLTLADTRKKNTHAIILNFASSKASRRATEIFGCPYVSYPPESARTPSISSDTF